MELQFTLKQRLALLAITLMLLLSSVDSNILNVAVPTIADSLATRVLNLKLAITSYLIGLALFVPISGYMADKFGTRKVLLTSVAAFTIFSALCGNSHGLVEIVIWRFFQGVSGACTIPVGRMLLLKTFGKENLVKTYIYTTLPVVLAPALAPLLSGIIVMYMSWRFIFWINVPLGVACFILAYMSVVDFTEPVKSFNWKAFIFLALGLGITSFSFNIFLYAMDLWEKIAIFGLGVFCLAVYSYVEFNSENRVINYSLFRLKTFRLSFLYMISSRTSFAGRNFLLALFFQLGMHFTPEKSGYLLAFLAIGLFSGRLLCRDILARMGFKRTLMMANYGYAAALASVGLVQSDLIYLVFNIILAGFFSTILFTANSILVYADVEDKDYGSAASMVNTIEELCFSLGVVLVATILEVFNNLLSYFSGNVFILTFLCMGLIGFFGRLVLMKFDDNSGKLLLIKESGM